MPVPLVLASTSPRRAELLQRFRLELEVVAPDPQAEANLPEQLPLPELEQMLQQVALAKVRSVAPRPRGIVLGADTVVHYEERLLGKPRDRDEARQTLRQLSGRSHRVVTGVAALAWESGLFATAAETTEVLFHRLSDREIEAYLDSGEPFDKAGSYGIQGLGGLLVRGIQGCYFNVVGLPLARVYRLLTGLGLDLLWQARPR